MRTDKENIKAFFSLLQAGLWEQRCRLPAFDNIDFGDVYKVASEQSVVGLIAAGLEQIEGERPDRDIVLPFMGQVLQLEQRNKAMNAFIADLMERLRAAGITAVLVKGQGVAQCYERPLWRACGDVDLLLDAVNYEKAKQLLIPLASSVEDEDKTRKHLAMAISSWVVELHGTLFTHQLLRLNRVIGEVQDAVLLKKQVRIWTNGRENVSLPSPDNDVFFIFSHILQHYFVEGIGLRQICDWCRLLWIHKDSIDAGLLERRLRSAGIMTEWKAFAALAVNYLGMLKDVMPFYSSDHRWIRKAEMVLAFVLETGNFGHNRDYTYQKKYPFVVYKAISLWKHVADTFKYCRIFPLDSMKVLIGRVIEGFSVALKEKREELL